MGAQRHSVRLLRQFSTQVSHVNGVRRLADIREACLKREGERFSQADEILQILDPEDGIALGSTRERVVGPGSSVELSGEIARFVLRCIVADLQEVATEGSEGDRQHPEEVVELEVAKWPPDVPHIERQISRSSTQHNVTDPLVIPARSKECQCFPAGILCRP
jgi:hypothetical protein